MKVAYKDVVGLEEKLEKYNNQYFYKDCAYIGWVDICLQKLRYIRYMKAAYANKGVGRSL